MIIVTGAAGFIGSNLIKRLNQDNFNHIIAVDEFDNTQKMKNLDGCRILEYVHRDIFFDWLDINFAEVEFCFHIGARTDTTEFDKDIFDKLNLNYSKTIWQKCYDFQIPLIYASSAATYGDGTLGFDDNEQTIPQLKPLNPYGDSKNDFDIWALKQAKKPFFWAGLKFFNVFGPNEYHKGRMASVVFHSYNQIKKNGLVRLFKSHNPNYTDGGQLRDFVYVKDVIEVCLFLMHSRRNSGIYNLGTGKARTFLDLTNATFKALNLSPNIEFIDTPLDIRDKYQYFTEAKMDKLRSIGYSKHFTTLEDAVNDYVVNYLEKE
jgi:ADP-L-glycero-D-manno-heptose 6-epimerase